jgi:predicted nucleic acid-binding protein
MPDKNFIDSNLLVYYSSDKGEKLSVVRELFHNSTEKIISLQTLNEFVNVCFKKQLLKPEEISKAAEAYKNTFALAQQTAETIFHAIRIKIKYRYSYFDSLVIATALEVNCSKLYSEDLQHNQKIEGRLIIINPFV